RQQAASGNTAVRGGSTISQQLAKNLFLSNSRSYARKGQELIITYMIELTMSKERILELYLNFAQWGADVFGAQAAAQRYYKGQASGLSSSQSARLASMLPRPAYYDLNGDTRYLRSRTATIQKRMRLVEVP
ncbi:MAG: monofunctional biosynthetic peptidoglycan transglycosylase, partial [Alcaligenaceae bacterium]|nr:monofunctional biosynthetic peptidoglycan transglycosylase [Alcaligenaceae bacterium]